MALTAKSFWMPLQSGTMPCPVNCVVVGYHIVGPPAQARGLTACSVVLRTQRKRWRLRSKGVLLINAPAVRLYSGAVMQAGPPVRMLSREQLKKDQMLTLTVEMLRHTSWLVPTGPLDGSQFRFVIFYEEVA